MDSTIKQTIWLLKAYFYCLHGLISIALDQLGIKTDSNLVAIGVVVIFILSLMFILRLIFGHLGSIMRLIGVALYVLVLTFAYNRLIIGG
jgi:uncharacterized membrane protein